MLLYATRSAPAMRECRFTRWRYTQVGPVPHVNPGDPPKKAYNCGALITDALPHSVELE